MKAKYKNKRDQYKAELEAERNAKALIEAELLGMKKRLKDKEDSDQKRYSATVYCSNCLMVSDVSIPPGVTVKDGDCIHCRCRGVLFSVKSYPGKISTFI